MKKARTLLVLFIALTVMAALFTGCSNGSSGNTGTQAPQSEAPTENIETEAPDETSRPPKAGGKATAGGYEFDLYDDDISEMEIAVICVDMYSGLSPYLQAGAEECAEEFGFSVYFTGPATGSSEDQYQIMDDLITKGVDGIAISCVDGEAMSPLITKALENGIPVVCMNTDVPASERLGYAGQDLVQSGRDCAQTLIDYMGESGKVVISTVGAAQTYAQLREQGMREVLEQYPDIEVINTVDTKGDAVNAYSMMESCYLANPDLKGVLDVANTFNYWGTLIGENPDRHMDSDNPLYVVGFNWYDDILYNISLGQGTASLSQNPTMQGYESVKMIYDFLTTGDASVFQVMDTGSTVIDKTEVDDVIARKAEGELIG